MAPFGSSCVTSVFGIAWKNGIDVRARKSGAAFVRLNVSVFPETLMPEIEDALPLIMASAPTMSERNG